MPQQADNRGKWCGDGYNSSSVNMGNNCHAVTIMLLKYLKGDNQPSQVELVVVQQAVTAMTRCSTALVVKATAREKFLEVKKQQPYDGNR